MIDYKMYYSMSFNPFEKGLDDHRYESIDFKEATARLQYLVDTKGIGLITGQSGVGKTYTTKKFCDSLNPGLYKVVYLPLSTLTTMEFYRSFCIGLGLEPQHKKIDNYRNIQSCIKQLVEQKRITPVIVLDESQYLKTDILNDIKLLLNYQFDSKNYIVLIIMGLPSLRNILNMNVHDPLKQRIIVQYHIQGLDGNEVKEYVIKKLEKAGRLNPLFSDDAFTALSNASVGSARRLNNLVTQALIIGATKNAQLIDSEIIMEAANELV